MDVAGEANATPEGKSGTVAGIHTRRPTIAPDGSNIAWEVADVVSPTFRAIG